MDAIDSRILRELQKDGRLTNQELSERVNLSPSPCLRRVRNLEKAGIIGGYAAIVDQEACGLPVTVFLQVRLDRHSEENVKAFEAAVERIDEIMECYLMAGDRDYLLRVVVANLADYEDFIRRRIHKIPGIASLDSSFAYGVVKRSQVLPTRP
ncbi:winged helix-turn-helix transcriptional regulator [Stappia sp. GBMRC 2046]|uniref:Winged helix-turn-helix transcriptional regulator n=1 Tax=Stappia sediminis TaxID=2692190 RepID=A0A7X3LXE1_9HYPH|nr:Lrp/AsnC family transcriptional regulator [Stappia sediminis]MXN66798.1 winged helix-turn-helix transcriptional regulator [Stappia sediminis]